jgi:hypothetical protein
MTRVGARATSGLNAPGLAACLIVLACSERRSTPKATTEPSPNASILPAPLASAAELATPTGQPGVPAVDSSGRIAAGDPEPPPEPAPADRPLPEDLLGARDSTGYTIEAAFRWADVPPPSPEASGALRDAVQRLELKLVIDLVSAGRMRFSFESAGFPLPLHTELRARASYYGHILVWPEEKAYRVVPAGSLRALFAERRADVAPLLRAVLRPAGSGLFLGHRTVQTELETSLGVLQLEQAAIPGSNAGELLCRLLVELVGAEPSNDACRPERVPLYAQYRWAGGGSIVFIATAISDRRDSIAPTVSVPPSGARWAPGELPVSDMTLLTVDELSRLKPRLARNPPGGRAAGEGVTGANETNLLQYLLLDGVPVAWLAPRSRLRVVGPPSGKYQVGWRDFFGTALTPPATVDVPGLVRVGTPDADAGSRP